MAQIVTITNPLTGQPTQVDQLDHTAQQIDDGLNIARGVSNPNLLDNWYFDNPVDQRQGYVVPPGVTTYSDKTLQTQVGVTSAYRTVVERTSTYIAFKTAGGVINYVAPGSEVRGYTGAGYGIDRWVFDNDSGNATILLTESGLKFVNGSSATGIGAINQKLPPELYSALAGKTVTLSILGKSSKAQQVLFLVNDAVFAVNGSAGGNNARLTTLTATLPQTINNFSIYVYGASEAGAGEGYIKTVKLELGSQQTLAHQDADGNWVLNELPNYADTLARCQRYYVPVGKGNFGMIVAGVNHGNMEVSIFEIPVPVTMRANPVIADVEQYGTCLIDGTWYPVTDLKVDCMHSGSVRVYWPSNGVTTTGPCVIDGAKFAFSAEL